MRLYKESVARKGHFTLAFSGQERRFKENNKNCSIFRTKNESFKSRRSAEIAVRVKVP
jgi:hypothetical protein